MKLLLTCFLVFFISGCANVDNALKIKKTNLLVESRLNQLPDNEIKMYFALNFSDGSGIFDGKINIVTINGLRILYNDKSNGIYIANKNNRFVRIENDVVTIYKNITESPSIGTEQIEATEQYINYYGDKYGFHDYGYDGHDVVYEIYNPENATSNIRGKECKTLTAKVACCKNGKSKYTGFVYSNNTGWAESDSHILEEKCQAIQE